MPKITIDGKEIECRPGIPVLQAALEAGWNIPHYCYHPGLSIVASCRLCLMEMKMPHPKTNELVWAPKLFPSCQTPVKDGLEVRFDSDAVRQNQRHVMEDYLLNHPLDCPVCDKAGECYLQDYSEEFGTGSSRMIEDKQKNPKKDIGPHTLLYQDRCVLCSRCVRFCDEIAGTGELRVISRGSRCEIDVFPGVPLENALQGNVVDLCPVGALLDKEFLFKQRVWLLRSTKSVSPADSHGQTIWIDWNEQGIHRIRPRYNEQVNEWWISDEARFGWKYVHRPDRLRWPRLRIGSNLQQVRWEDIPSWLAAQVTNQTASERDAAYRTATVRERLPGNGTDVAAVLSPMLSCEEAWLLATWIRSLAPQATLVLGHVPVLGEDQKFPKGFVIKAEKCPNRRGIETILTRFGGPTATWREFLGRSAEGQYRFAYVTGGYPAPWLDAEAVGVLSRVSTLVLHDLFPSGLEQHAAAIIPGASWAEREGSFMNADGLLQAFDRAIPPWEGVKADGQFFYELAGLPGIYRAARVRELAATGHPQETATTTGQTPILELASVFVPEDLPEHAH